MNIKRLGFCCKWIDRPDQVDGVKATDDAKQYNTSGTTITWLNKQKKDVAEQKLWDLMVSNIESVHKLVKKVGALDETLRMVRIGSDVLPAYTHESWSYFWRRIDVMEYCSKHFRAIGDVARATNVRLSFHPGQYVCLASDNPDIVDRSIEEFEYHVDMARWMGYGVRFQDLKINVHIAGRKGPQGIIDVLGRLSPEARNCITIENDEMSWGIDSSLELAKHCALVLDIHHHWIRTGEYITPEDDRCLRVIDSWRGVRPVIHYSVSREDVLVNHNPNVMPDHAQLLTEGYKKAKLRAHSDFYWNNEVNKWALTFNDQFDIICELKSKNLGSFRLHEYAKKIGLAPVNLLKNIVG